VMVWASFSLHAKDDVMFVAAPVASVWELPDLNIKSFTLPLISDDLPQHLTQVLYGERVEIVERNKAGWCKVNVLDQAHFNRKVGVWGFCDGWMFEKDLQAKGYEASFDVAVTELWAAVHSEPNEKSPEIQRLSFGTLLPIGKNRREGWQEVCLLDGKIAFIKASDVSQLLVSKLHKSELLLRQCMVEYVHKFLGLPYCWDGRCAYSKTLDFIPTSVDCSGLVNLVYSACGFRLPRHAHSQFMRAMPIEPKNMQPGDLMFFKRGKHNFDRVNHVLMYVGGDEFIEATESSKSVRIITTQIFFGKSLIELKNGEHFSGGSSRWGDIEIHCGSFLASPELRNEPRIK